MTLSVSIRGLNDSPPLLIPISCNFLLLIKVDVADLGLACGSSRNQTNAGKLLVTCERECPDMNSDRLISQEDRIYRLSSNLNIGREFVRQASLVQSRGITLRLLVKDYVVKLRDSIGLLVKDLNWELGRTPCGGAAV